MTFPPSVEPLRQSCPLRVHSPAGSVPSALRAKQGATSVARNPRRPLQVTVPELRTETLSCCSQPRRTLRVFYGTRRASPARRELIRNPRREHNGIGIIEKPAEARRRSSVLARVQRSRALPQLIGAWSRHSLDAADHLLLTGVEGGCLRPGSAALAQVAGTESPIGNLGCPFFFFRRPCGESAVRGEQAAGRRGRLRPRSGRPTCQTWRIDANTSRYRRVRRTFSGKLAPESRGGSAYWRGHG
jgi:hypothetical protein